MNSKYIIYIHNIFTENYGNIQEFSENIGYIEQVGPPAYHQPIHKSQGFQGHTV